MSLRELRRRTWVKENLKKAREHPVHGEPLTLFRAALEMESRESYVCKWEDPEMGSPSPENLDRVVRWIEKRLGVKAPR